MTLSITAFRITTLSIKGLFVTLSMKDTQRKRHLDNNNAIVLSVAFIYCYAECRYAECHHAKCRYSVCSGTQKSAQ
jgi:hypothetical protein